MQAIAVANLKGGVGKTTVTRNIAPHLARRRRVLCVDADPQGALSRAFGVVLADDAPTLADVLTGAAPIAAAIVETPEGLAVVPADRGLAEAELTIAGKMGRETTLRRALGAVADRFDLVLIDAPPALSLLSVNVLAAVGAVLIPTRPNTQDLHALREFLATVVDARAALNERLEVLGIVPNEYDARLTLHTDAMAAMREAHLPVLGVTIGRSVRVAEAMGAAQSIATYDAGNPRADEFKQLAKEVDRWLTRNQK